MDRQAVERKLRIIADNSNSAINFGHLGSEGIRGGDANRLKSMENQSENVLDDPIVLVDQHSKSISVEILDSDIQLRYADDKLSYEPLRRLLFDYFNKTVLLRDGSNFEYWQQLFSQFIVKIVDRRMTRVRDWFKLNVKQWEDDSDIARVRGIIEIGLLEMQRKWDLCLKTCDKCFFACMLTARHDQAHDCWGKHKCVSDCEYCTKNGETLQCADKSGHSGSHNCKQKDHTCNKICHLSALGNCNKSCSLASQHEGDCRCNSKLHLCGKPCTAAGCKAFCSINEEKKHTIHKCDSTRCSFDCYFKSTDVKCAFPCASKDHFHGDKSLSQQYAKENGIAWDENSYAKDHFCPNEHSCPKDCEKDGICHIKLELVKEKREETFKGRRGEFKYQAVREANGERLKCCHRIPVGKKKHSGPHEHSTDTTKFHYCEEKCPSCGYFCELEKSHNQQLHKTSHGNMRHTYFVSDTQNIDIGDRKYEAGEHGVAEMCKCHFIFKSNHLHFQVKSSSLIWLCFDF